MEQEKSATKRIFSERLAELMRVKGLNQSALAAAAGSTQSAISNYLSGARMPRSEEALRLARSLGVTIEWLLGWDAPQSGRPTAELFELSPSAMTEEEWDRIKNLTADQEAEAEITAAYNRCMLKIAAARGELAKEIEAMNNRSRAIIDRAARKRDAATANLARDADAIKLVEKAEASLDTDPPPRSRRSR